MAKVIVSLLLGLLLFSCSETSYRITGNIDAQVASDKTGNVESILQEFGIIAEYALIIADDGTAFFISENSFSEIEINSKKGKFNSGSSNLPPVCNLNNIIEICVYNSDFPVENHQTPFSVRMNDFEFLGENSRKGHFVKKYRLKGSNQ
jgi:hypothetical protein